MKRQHSPPSKKPRGRQEHSADDGQAYAERVRAITFLHTTLGNYGVSRLFGGSSLSRSASSVSIQRQDSKYVTRMKEAFRKAGITEEMIRGERTDGFIDYDEEKGVARWVPIRIVAPVPKPSREAEKARMMEAFRKAGITDEMIRGERTDGFIDYDEETGVARWLTITKPAVPSAKPDGKDEKERMKEAFRKGGITEEMIRGERTDGFIFYDEETGTARWETITFPALPAEPARGRKPAKRKK